MLSKLGYELILLDYSCSRFFQSLVSIAKIPRQFAQCRQLLAYLSVVGTGSLQVTLILRL